MACYQGLKMICQIVFCGNYLAVTTVPLEDMVLNVQVSGNETEDA